MRRITYDFEITEEEAAALDEALSLLPMGTAEAVRPVIERITSLPVVCNVTTYHGGTCGFPGRDSLHEPPEKSCRFPAEHHEFTP